MKQPTAMGIIFETKYLDNAKAAITNIDALSAIKLAQGTKAYGIVLAGRLHKKDAGCFAAILPDNLLIEQCALAAQTRLREIGSQTTTWVVKLDDKAIEQSVLATLKSGAE
jgi:hypothetical protein